MNKMRTLLFGLLVAALSSGCGIDEEQHRAVVEDLEQCKTDYAALEAARAETEEALNTELADLNARIAALTDERNELQTGLDAAMLSLETYTEKTGTLEQKLNATTKELAQLRQQRAEAEKRVQEYRNLLSKFASMIEAGTLKVVVRDNKMLLQLPDNVLFDTGKTKVKEQGVAALVQIADVLKNVANRDFLVAGHTDNVPISSGRFDSNWELSTARAVEVVQLLQEAGVSPEVLAAAGYGEYEPIASNETKEGRALNRRIEIVLMPNINELPPLPADVATM